MRVCNINNTNNQNQPAFGLNFSKATEAFIKNHQSEITEQTNAIIKELRSNKNTDNLDIKGITTFMGAQRIYAHILEKQDKIAGDLYPKLSEAITGFFKEVKLYCDSPESYS